MPARRPILPIACDRYGAGMGRRRTGWASSPLPIRFHLTRVRIDAGGYDAGGAYWGFGRPLYQYEGADIPGPTGPDETPLGYLRADSREDAKAAIRAQFPNALFYR